ncbi:hypothetical protein, partial [Photobacterium sanguinicancri]
MTSKRYDDPIIKQWLVELDAISRHEILHYLVEWRELKAGDFFIDDWHSISLLQCQMDASSLYFDKLCEIEDDTELAELENSVGSLAGQHQLERFLDEKDFLLQVIEKNGFDELSSRAREVLISKYPLAMQTVKYLMSSINEQPLPSCLWSTKLNDHFRAINLLSGNSLEDILVFHADLIDRLDNNRFRA